MPTIAYELDQAFRTAIREAFDVDTDPLVGASQSDKFGDYQSNAAMGLAKILSDKTGQKSNPRVIAEQIKARVTQALGNMVTEVTIAGPGFINVRLNPAWVSSKLHEISSDKTLGLTLAPSPQIVVVDYSGPNIAKEMHVGHLRSTIIGDAIANVIETLGHTVIRQNHIGDWGTQFGMLIRYLLEEGPSTNLWHMSGVATVQVPGQFVEVGRIRVQDLESFYRAAKTKFDVDPQFKDRARLGVVALQAGDRTSITAWQAIVEETRRHFQPLYDRLRVKLTQEHERGESFYNPMLLGIVKVLREKQLAIESDGATVVLVEGFESPLIIQKTDGGYLYGTTDLAALRYRVDDLHASRIIYVTDSRQSQHFAMVFAVGKQAGWVDDVSLEHAPFGTMMGEDGKPFKTRSGDTVKLKDLLDEAEVRAMTLVTAKNPDLPEEHRKQIARAIGIGAVKYSDLSKDRVSDYVFSWDKMLAMDGNTGPYLQYAYARIRSIHRKAHEGKQLASGAQSDAPAAPSDAPASQPNAPAPSITLDSPFELALAKHILRLGETMDVVARDLKPHVLCLYLYELASKFSSFYENCPVLKSEEPLRTSRLMLSDLTARTLALGLDLLGIEHPEQM